MLSIYWHEQKSITTTMRIDRNTEYIDRLIDLTSKIVVVTAA